MVKFSIPALLIWEAPLGHWELTVNRVTTTTFIYTIQVEEKEKKTSIENKIIEDMCGNDIQTKHSADFHYD